MEQRITHEDMDSILKKLEDDYIEALDNNKCTTVEDFVEQFLTDSWDYNHQNMKLIKSVMSRYTQGEIYQYKFSGAFNEMVDHLQKKLADLDKVNTYPLVHSPLGASVLVAFVDGLVIQLFAGVYELEDLRKQTPALKSVILKALAANPEV